MIVVDSCKLRIPLSEVELIDPQLLGQVKTLEVVEGTGELIGESFKDRAFLYTHSGIRFRALVERIRTFNFHADYLSLLVNSKMLGGAYFQGLSLDTLPALAEFINQLGIVKISKEILLNAELTDVDFKEDYSISKDDITPVLVYWERMFKGSNKEGVFVKLRDNGKAHMLQCNSRATSSYQGRPFLKVYSKALEMEFNSPEFASEYLALDSYQDLYRVEFTIKNKKHFKHFGIEDTSLGSIFSIPQDRLKAIQKSIIYQNIALPKDLETKSKKGLSPQEVSYLNLIEYHQGLGLDHFTLLKVITKDLAKDTSIRYKKAFDKALHHWASKVSDNEKVKAKESIQSYEKAQAFLDHFTN